MRKVVHKLFWLKFTCAMPGMTWGWKTACGEKFWPWFRGTTERKDVTCKRCLKFLDKITDAELEKQRKYGKVRWSQYLAEMGIVFE